MLQHNPNPSTDAGNCVAIVDGSILIKSLFGDVLQGAGYEALLANTVRDLTDMCDTRSPDMIMMSGTLPYLTRTASEAAIRSISSF